MFLMLFHSIAIGIFLAAASLEICLGTDDVSNCSSPPCVRSSTNQVNGTGDTTGNSRHIRPADPVFLNTSKRSRKAPTGLPDTAEHIIQTYRTTFFNDDADCYFNSPFLDYELRPRVVLLNYFLIEAANQQLAAKPWWKPRSKTTKQFMLASQALAQFIAKISQNENSFRYNWVFYDAMLGHFRSLPSVRRAMHLPGITGYRIIRRELHGRIHWHAQLILHIYTYARSTLELGSEQATYITCAYIAQNIGTQGTLQLNPNVCAVWAALFEQNSDQSESSQVDSVKQFILYPIVEVLQRYYQLEITGMMGKSRGRFLRWLTANI